ncbi:hypothetical protein N7495_007841 [Penicillium taxi]|uniref:uncharacterized protein n=1 Tax=Penicillium taxi TaxID=168475 RepID=UPI00254592FC|nr:uncharacterized protein N7495_007841 [Penicillium taxi]KAJ5887800.1 hypothetical protein N7495_007841 [Penicillium taxi]
MKFLPLPDYEDVTSSLTFDTSDCHIIGSCELYTIKAARADRKLHQHIEESLEAQYESNLRLSASLSPPNASAAAAALNLSRSSPFGPMSEVSSRRTFAYLIATLNASHTDYEFSNLLRPADFRHERHLNRIMEQFNSTLSNLKPCDAFAFSPSSPATLSGSYTDSPLCGPRMWRLVDTHMTLKDCVCYSYAPDGDSFEADQGALWSLHYFFFNPQRKRVTYLYLRAVPLHLPPDDGVYTPTEQFTMDDAFLTPDSDGKRSRWFSPRGEIFENGDEMDAKSKKSRHVVDDDEIMISDEDQQTPEKVRAMSEEIADSMEV